MESRKWWNWQDRSFLSTNKIYPIIYHKGYLERDGLYSFLEYCMVYWSYVLHKHLAEIYCQIFRNTL